jgi:hypothetical protein
VVGCDDDSSSGGPNGDAGVIFDPCVANPQPGYDPVAANLPACCTDVGPAHCVPTSQVLPALAAQLMTCDATSVCMPDPIIHGGGAYVPQSCTSSVGGGAGVCLSQCIPLVANNPQSALLGQDGCGLGELCVPCLNPIDHTETGACSINAKLCGTGGPDMAGNNMSGCPYTGPPILDPSTMPQCSPACGGAHCLPKSLVPAAQQSLLDPCTAAGGAEGLCAPDVLIQTGGNYVPPTCTSVAGAEGRCLSVCLPSVAAEATLLPQDSCGSGEKCVPCYNPTAADPTAPTGACNLACDAPAKPPVILTCPWTGPPVVDPSIFPACSPSCGGAHCVPKSLVPTGSQALLASCDNGNGLCAPDPIIAANGLWVPKSCTSVAGAEGRCLSTCLPDVAAQTLLPQSSCAAGERCVPCYNPVANDPTAPTGACSLACDKPTKPPVILMCPWTGPAVIDPAMLPACTPTCSGAHCLPAQYVPPAQQSLLAPCTGGYCTPDPMISTAGNYKPPTCVSFAGVPQSEGRCLSTCLPSVSSQASLEQSSCAAGNKCAPCWNPINSVVTGACSTSSCDHPASTTPYVFPDCCIYNGKVQGRCVPKSQIPSSQQGSLKQDICSSSVYLCVPNINLPGSGVTGQGCRATLILPYDGSCISNCVDLGLGTLFPQGNCPGNYTCIPCSQAPPGSPGC